jgi:phosphotransferase system HPr (HPr) family protein
MGQEIPSESRADETRLAASRRVRVPNAAGLHARPCHALASTALGFQSDVEVSCSGRRANGKSILELMTLHAAQGAELEFSARGPDAAALVAALSALVDAGFGEPS